MENLWKGGAEGLRAGEAGGVCRDVVFPMKGSMKTAYKTTRDTMGKIL